MLFAWDDWNLTHIARHGVGPEEAEYAAHGHHEEAISTENAMKSKAIKNYSARELDRMALDMSDVKPMSASMRRKWEAAKQTGKQMHRGRPRKAPTTQSRIVPVSIDPSLLSEADRFAKSAGISRSRLVAEALRLRMNIAVG